MKLEKFFNVDPFDFSIFVQVKNLFEKDYETFGLYGEADEVLEDVNEDETRFLSPGSPRTLWLGLKLRW